MKRFIGLLGIAVVAVAATAAYAMAAPAPKTTGDIGYTAGSDVQRHLTFNAIQSSTNTQSTFWNVSGITKFDFTLDNDPAPGTHYIHDAALTQTGQSVTGSGGWPVGGPYQYAWHVTSGSVVGNVLNLTMTYDTGVPGVVHTMTGTIDANGSVSGTWSDNAGPGGSTRTGQFTATGATAITYNGKGSALYTDASGLWYLVNVKAVSVSGQDAWFAGPVIAGNVGVGSWLVANVHDGGEPGKLVDQVSGEFTDEVTAINKVTKQDQSYGPFTITSGNLQVH